MNYTIITENDESDWHDRTGETYHFPKRYLGFLKPNTQVVYYKGRLKNKKFALVRLSGKPHYFGIGKIGTVTIDDKSTKGDYFAEIKNFTRFDKAVDFREDGAYFEKISESQSANYWRNGVRPIEKGIYDRIRTIAGISETGESDYNDNNHSQAGLESYFFAGGKKLVYGTVFERDQRARAQALRIHGYSCMACDLNFEKMYGKWGEGFIHVHHTKPVSTIQSKQRIDPRKDLIVLCPNCHWMVHRKKKSILSLEELKTKINTEKEKL